MRLDVFLKENNFAKSRAKAQELILNNFILIDRLICNDVKKELGENFDKKRISIIQNEEMGYVSRSYKKLKAGLEKFEIRVEGKICLDIGSSTGGFTQVLCEENAKEVFSIDVGSDQFDKELLKKYEKKITLLERTDIRNFGKLEISNGGAYGAAKNQENNNKNIYKNYFDLVVCDISFISITKIVSNIFELLKDGGEGVMLIKPQFEVGRENIGKGGLVKSNDENISYEELIEITTNNIKNIFENNNLKVINIIDSPIQGGDGNKEFLMYIQK